MPKIHRYAEIDEQERESRKEFIDKHSPFIHCARTAKKGEPFKITVRVGEHHAHLDEFDHYIANIQLYTADTLLARADFVAGIVGGEQKRGNAEVTFSIVPMSSKLTLVAHSYCTKHGLWESEPIEVSVSE